MRTAISALLLAVACEAAAVYNITDLGAVTMGAPSSMNNSGAVAYSNPAPAAINNFGQVVGTTQADGRSQAAMWVNGMVSVLGIANAGESFGLALNDWGWMGGAATDGAGRMTAYLIQDGMTRWLGTLPGGSWSSLNALNGTFGAGTSEAAGGAFHAFAWSISGGMTDLGTLGGVSSYGMAVNARGLVVGNSQIGGGLTHAFAHDGVRMIDLGALNRDSSFATGVNNNNEIVGYSGGSAFLVRNGVMADLNRLIAADAGWRLLEANAINDNGQIVGTGILNGEQRAFRLDPISQSELDQALSSEALLAPALIAAFAEGPVEPSPEPATFAICGAACLLLGSLRLRRR